MRQFFFANVYGNQSGASHFRSQTQPLSSSSISARKMPVREWPIEVRASGVPNDVANIEHPAPAQSGNHVFGAACAEDVIPIRSDFSQS